MVRETSWNCCYDPKYAVLIVKHGGGSIMVWGCFHRGDIGPIIKVEGTIDRFLYREILQTHMLSYAEDNLPVTWVFQHDNDSKHASTVIRQ